MNRDPDRDQNGPQEGPGLPKNDKSRGHGRKSAAKRDAVILALLSGKTVPAAAAECGVHHKTIHAWLAEDEGFKRELSEGRRIAFEAGLHRIQSLSTKAIDTLEELLDKAMPPTVRLGAARTVAELGLSQHDAETILRRLDQVEAALRTQDGRK